jgi:hypothetical protein
MCDAPRDARRKYRLCHVGSDTDTCRYMSEKRLTQLGLADATHTKTSNTVAAVHNIKPGVAGEDISSTALRMGVSLEGREKIKEKTRLEPCF